LPIGGTQENKPRAADEDKAEISNQFVMVRLANPEEVDNLSVEIIQHFYLGRFL
jgi:hypothetical protein